MSYCRYDLAWRGPCRQHSENDICEFHSKIKCQVCGAQATKECDHTGQFVCGTPLCDNCEGITDTSKPSGGWGFANHTHKQKNLKEISEPEKKQVSRIIRITDCKDCPHKGHKGGFGNPAYVPRCSKTGKDLPYTTGVNGRMIIAKQVPGIPEWCPLEKD